MNKTDAPREVEVHTVNCLCDHCGKSLNSVPKIWIWNEHFGCSRDHVQRAQASTNLQKMAEMRDIDFL